MKRRTLFAAGIGLLAAPMILRETAAMAASGEKTKMDATTQPQFNQFKLGSYKFTVFKDGATIAEKPYETFGTNQKPEAVQELLAKNFLPTDKFVNSYAPTLIDTVSDVILIDTGFGEGGRARGSGQLREGLKAAGYTPDDITLVALTHLHGDHIGGLMEGGAPAFKNARYVIGQIEFDFWTDKAREGTPAEGGHKAVLANVVPFPRKRPSSAMAALSQAASPRCWRRVTRRATWFSTSNPRASASWRQVTLPITIFCRCRSRTGRFASIWTRRRQQPRAARCSA